MSMGRDEGGWGVDEGSEYRTAERGEPQNIEGGVFFVVSFVDCCSSGIECSADPW